MLYGFTFFYKCKVQFCPKQSVILNSFQNLSHKQFVDKAISVILNLFQDLSHKQLVDKAISVILNSFQDLSHKQLVDKAISVILNSFQDLSHYQPFIHPRQKDQRSSSLRRKHQLPVPYKMYLLS